MARTQPNPAPVPAAASSDAAGVSLYDARPFFEKALQHGLQQGLIDAAKLDAIALDAPKGMVQIARYFGNEFLRPDLEKARERIVNLVSLHLEHSTGGVAAGCLGHGRGIRLGSRHGLDRRFFVRVTCGGCGLAAIGVSQVDLAVVVFQSFQ